MKNPHLWYGLIVLGPLIPYALYLVYHEAAALIRHERRVHRYLNELDDT